jgi:hypothetical protein
MIGWKKKLLIWGSRRCAHIISHGREEIGKHDVQWFRKFISCGEHQVGREGWRLWPSFLEHDPELLGLTSVEDKLQDECEVDTEVAKECWDKDPDVDRGCSFYCDLHQVGCKESIHTWDVENYVLPYPFLLCLIFFFPPYLNLSQDSLSWSTWSYRSSPGSTWNSANKLDCCRHSFSKTLSFTDKNMCLVMSQPFEEWVLYWNCY